MRRLEDPSWRADEHGFVDLHTPIIILPVQRRDLTPIAPILRRIEVTGSNASSTRVYPSKVQERILDELIEGGGQEGRDGGFGDVDEDVSGLRYVCDTTTLV